MCLSVPAKVLKLNDQSAVVRMGSNSFTVSTALLDSVEPGDYVLIHTGFAIEVVSEEAAEEMQSILREIIKYSGD